MIVKLVEGMSGHIG